jgi:hypothetical protein
MPKGKFLVLISIFFLLLGFFLSFSQPVYALSTDDTTCDLCGWCNRPYGPTPPGWQKCYDCIYDPMQSGVLKPTPHVYTVFGCFSTNPNDFVRSILSIFFGISGGIAFLVMVFGTTVILTSSGDPQRLQMGRDIITSSIFGLLLIIFSVFLLRTIGYDILQLPGFE